MGRESPSAADRIDDLRSRVEALERRVDAGPDTPGDGDGAPDDAGGSVSSGRGFGGLSRRSLLQGAAAGGLLGYGTATAAADPQGEVGTGSDPLQKLYTEELNGGVTGDTAVTDLTGAGLSINSGTLSAAGAAAWEDASSSNDLLEPSSGPKGIEVDQLSSDPNITDDMGAVYASDSGATGSAGDVVIGSDSGGTTRQTVLFEFANGGIPGSSLTASSVGTSELNTPFTDLATLVGTPVSAGGDVDIGSNNINSVASIDGGGSAIGVDDAVNLSNSDSIQDAGTDAIQFDGSQNITVPNGDVDLGSNNIDSVASIDGGGSAISVDDAINLSNSDSIQDAGTDAIQFDGSQNVTIPNGDLDLSSGNKLSLPQVTSDPSGASAGDMWYRSDLD